MNIHYHQFGFSILSDKRALTGRRNVPDDFRSVAFELVDGFDRSREFHGLILSGIGRIDFEPNSVLHQTLSFQPNHRTAIITSVNVPNASTVDTTTLAVTSASAVL